MKYLAAYKNFFFFVLVIFLGRCAWFMSMPFMAVYFSKNLHAGPIAIGLVIGMGLLSSCIAGLFIGGLVDRFNAKWLLILAQTAAACVFFLFTLKLNLTAYAILNIFLGIFRALIDATSQAFIMELLPESKRAMGLNLRYVLINISATIAPLFGGFFISYSAHALFSIAGFIYLASMSILFVLPKIQHAITSYNIWQDLQATTKLLLRNHAAKMIFLIEAVTCIGFAQLETTLPQIMSWRIGEHYVYFYSWLLAMNSLIVVVTQMFISRALRNIPAKQIIFLFTVLLTLAFVSFALSHNTYQFFLATFAFGIAEVIGVTFYNDLINKHSTPNNRGAYFGVVSFALIGYPIGAFLGGILLKFNGGVILFLSAALITTIIGIYGIKQAKLPLAQPST